jgi:hypothetical protein
LLPGDVFLLHSVKEDLAVQDDRSNGWRPGGWEIRSPGGRPAVSFIKTVGGLDIFRGTCMYLIIQGWKHLQLPFFWSNRLLFY